MVRRIGPLHDGEGFQEYLVTLLAAKGLEDIVEGQRRSHTCITPSGYGHVQNRFPDIADEVCIVIRTDLILVPGLQCGKYTGFTAVVGPDKRHQTTYAVPVETSVYDQTGTVLPSIYKRTQIPEVRYGKSAGLIIEFFFRFHKHTSAG